MMRRTHRVLFGLAGAAALAGVFALYTRPEMVVALADMMWACFGPAGR